MQAPDHARELGPVRLRGAVLASAEVFRSALAALAEGRRVAVVDLSLGAWRSHAAAESVAEQLGIPVPKLPLPIPRRGLDGGPPRPADFASMNIDVEALGERTTLASYAQARACARALAQRPSLIALIPPLAGARWDAEDLCFVRFLGQQLVHGDAELMLVAPSAAALEGRDCQEYFTCEPASAPAYAEQPQANTLAPWLLFPGVLPKHIAARCRARDPESFAAQTVELEGGLCAICPSERTPLASLKPRQFGAAQALVSEPGWLATYFAYHGFRLHLDAGRMAGEAIRRFGEGGLDLALRLMEKACEVIASPAARAQAYPYLGRMYLLRGMFEKAAALPDCAGDLDPAARATLLELKGWGLVMEGETARALACFERAHAQGAWEAGTRERLYLRNIWALALQRHGDARAALRAEAEIADALAARVANGQRQDWPLVYVNAINRGRLHRQLDEHREAWACFERAFETTDGVRSESDLFYQPLCRARSYAARGRFRDELVQLVTAALFWCASEVPEAIGRRALSTLLGTRLALEGALYRRVAPALHEVLCKAARRAGLDPSEAPHSFRISALRRLRSEQRARLVAVAGPGLGFFASAEQLPMSVDDADHARLRACLSGLLAQLIPGLSAQGFASLAMDAREGRGAPVDGRQLLERCAWLGVSRTFNLANEEGVERAQLVVAWAPAVEHVDDAQRRVVFRRYRPTLELDPATWRLLQLVPRERAGELPLTQLEAEGGAASLEMLVRARVLVVRLSAAASQAEPGARRSEI